MSRYNDSPVVEIRFAWNPNAFRGFVTSCIVLAVILLVSKCTKYEPAEPITLKRTIPITLMVFGEGDGTGMRKGNLTKEGAAQRGKESPNPLQDAQRSASSNGRNQVTDPNQSARLIATRDVGTDGRRSDQSNADRNTGLKDGKDDGTGLNWVGTGTGKGLGYGDIDWGGGGNRTVVSKPMPKFPPGILNTEVKLRFRVLADGTVSLVWPVRRGGNPVVDQEAMKALKQWRFNRLHSEVEMEGTITFVFKNS